MSNNAMRSHHRLIGRALKAAAILAATTVALTACGTAPSTDSAEGTSIRFALDWTPNTNHTGLYVAMEKGYFADAGLDVSLVDYNNVLPDTLMDAGHAEFGVSFHDATTMAQATGANVVAVMAVLQDWASAIAVRADNDSIQSPKDLDGTTYAGFGEPAEIPLLTQVIQNDGGTGDFEQVVLGTSAYEALYSGDADFVIPFFAWEGVEAERRGNPLKYFHYTDYGFPQSYAVVIDANRDWIEKHPTEAAAFVQALQRGYQFAAEHPDEAADILIAANPGFFDDEDMVRDSQRILADQLMLDADGTAGTIDAEHWAGYSQFLFEHQLLTDENGDVLTAQPDWSTYYTTDLLSETLSQ
ncbi:ABC transporter substrate-binding protein [Lysinibacter cavernae]|uniref:ABC-type nitrate/sulfonate/bicarbonate transport system substrate-binding protein n=1 Tax=Lysinibacter cavernae TaxID=1640652 RepID=A0A7X5TSI9_9MICO|nr:ABC transporter substrate-binding protein [Lysinibacter cavernae]NIH53065.1 ABC-type nitrate/sulfonate/bicarbonate transport system substrate-binding protein [Lysinibacter cavernae]